MRWLADECVSAALVKRLRSVDHDVSYVAEIAPALSDRDVVVRAAAGDRLLLTEDKDFGELLVLQQMTVPGLILLRVGSALPEEQ